MSVSARVCDSDRMGVIGCGSEGVHGCVRGYVCVRGGVGAEVGVFGALSCGCVRVSECVRARI